MSTTRRPSDVGEVGDVRDVGVADTMREVPGPVTAGASAGRSFFEDAPLIAGRYRVIGMIGAGAMGTVYRARDTELDENVALKVLHRELAAAPGLLERFRQEVRLARKVTHANVARVFDIGEHAGDRFLTMELVDGESLADVIARQGAMPLARVAAIVRAIAAGLDAAHRASVVHRDLKPDNVLVAHDGRMVITDFGIARALAGTGMRMTGGGFVGTPAYMAPEQVEALKDVDARADVYALGEIAFELATGTHPWPGTEPFAVAAARLLRPPPDPRTLRPGMPPAFASAIMRAMARDRDQRTAQATKLADELEQALANDPAGARAGALTAAPPAASGSMRAGAIAMPAELSLAVLPFASDGVDAELANGMTGELVDALSMTTRLLVRPHGVTSGLADRASDPAGAGRELGVDAVVTGMLRHTPDGVRVSARVISVGQGFQLWARRFDCQTRDLLAVTDEIAHAIAGALSTAMRVPVREPVADGDAVVLYLRARAIVREGWYRAEVLAPAIALIEEARAKAPHDPTILAGWAIARARGAFLGSASPEYERQITLAREAAERVVSESPHIGEAWIALATVRWIAGDNVGLIRALRGALDASPSFARAHDLLGRTLLEHGEIDAAVARLELALSLDPSNDDPRVELARAHALRGHWDACEAILELPVRDGAPRPTKGLFAARFAVWRGVRDPSWPPPPPVPLDNVSTLMLDLFAGVVRTGRVDPEVLREMDNLDRPVRRLASLLAQMRAEAFVATGEIDRAFDEITLAVDTGLLDLAWMDAMPLFGPIRNTDPRWPPLRARVAERVVPALTVARELGFVG